MLRSPTVHQIVNLQKKIETNKLFMQELQEHVEEKVRKKKI